MGPSTSLNEYLDLVCFFPRFFWAQSVERMNLKITHKKAATFQHRDNWLIPHLTMNWYSKSWELFLLFFFKVAQRKLLKILFQVI